MLSTCFFFVHLRTTYIYGPKIDFFMARQRKGILDGFSGSVRNLTGQKKDGQNIIRLKPSKPNPSKSTEQAKTRSDFAKAVDIYQLFRRPEFDKLWAAKDDSKTHLNNFISANIRYSFSLGLGQMSKIFGKYISDRQNFTIAGTGSSGNRVITFFFNKLGGGLVPENSDIFVGFVAFPN